MCICDVVWSTSKPWDKVFAPFRGAFTRVSRERLAWCCDGFVVRRMGGMALLSKVAFRHFDHYRVAVRATSGGFGMVYRCDARRNDVVGPKQVVAVKVVNKYEGGLHDADIVRKEIQNLMVVNGHRCIVNFLSWMETTFDMQMVSQS